MYLNVQVKLKWDIITFLKKINISFLKSSTKSVYFLAIVEMKKSKINYLDWFDSPSVKKNMKKIDF